MKKLIAFAIILLLSLTITTGYDNSKTTKRMPIPVEKAPTLEVVIFGVNAPDQRIQAIQLTTSWGYTYKDGTGRNYSSDCSHPLQAAPEDFDNLTIYVDSSDNEIELLFSDDYPPETISVQRWNAEYAVEHDISDLLDKGEPVEENEFKIQISADGCDYIYEVYATWSQGSSYYDFFTVST